MLRLIVIYVKLVFIIKIIACHNTHINRKVYTHICLCIMNKTLFYMEYLLITLYSMWMHPRFHKRISYTRYQKRFFFLYWMEKSMIYCFIIIVFRFHFSFFTFCNNTECNCIICIFISLSFSAFNEIYFMLVFFSVYFFHHHKIYAIRIL